MPPAKKPPKPKAKSPKKPAPLRIADLPFDEERLASDRHEFLTALEDATRAVTDANYIKLPAAAERCVLAVLECYSETFGSSRATVKLALRILGCD